MRSATARLIAGVDMAGHFMGPAPGGFPAVLPGLEQFRFHGADDPAPARPPAAARAPDSAPEHGAGTGAGHGASTDTRTRRRPRSAHELPAAPGRIASLAARRSPSLPFSPLHGRDGHDTRHACV
jgi:hypothetical protein